MSLQRRTALVSVAAAVVLMAVKLVTGLASGSLGLVSEALHSGTDLVAALLTFFAVGYSGKPADVGHQYGHDKAEHLAALAEAAVLAAVSVGVAALAVARLVGWVEFDVEAAWWAFAAVGVVIVVDILRTAASRRAAREFASPALASNALHFGSDLAGTFAVLAGLVSVHLGWAGGDSVAALFVAVLVLGAAARLMRRNIDVLMDRAPSDAVAAARAAIAAVEAPLELRRLRLRQAAGRYFADVVIGVPPASVVGQGHAVADQVEDALRKALPGIDVVVHVEPDRESAALRERVTAAALSVSEVREIHNLTVLELGDSTEVSLHMKLSGEMTLRDAHEVAEAVERAILTAVTEIDAVQTHLEPLDEGQAGQELDHVPSEIDTIVREATGVPARAARVVRTDEGLVVLLTLGTDGLGTLSDAHSLATAIEEQIRARVPAVSDVVVHTEP